MDELRKLDLLLVEIEI